MGFSKLGSNHEALDEEGNLDEEKVNTCGKCFEDAEKLGATEESEEAAKACTIEHLPNFYEDCKDLVESSDDNAQEVLACFMNYVEVFDQTGEIREGVKEELAKEEEGERATRPARTCRSWRPMRTSSLGPLALLKP